MNSSDFRAEARKKLDGRWGKIAVLTLVYSVILAAFSIFANILPKSIKSICTIAVYIIEIPLIYGFTVSLFRVFKGEEVQSLDFWNSGFQNFKKSWGIVLNTALKMIVPAIIALIGYVVLFSGIGMNFVSTTRYYDSSIPSSSYSVVVIIGIIIMFIGYIWSICRSYYYQLAMIISIDNPEMNSKDAVLKSQEMMKGNRSKLFVLQLSFIGWAILAAFTCGIGYLFLLPYIQFAIFEFYMYLCGKKSETGVESVNEVPQNTDADNSNYHYNNYSDNNTYTNVENENNMNYNEDNNYNNVVSDEQNENN